MRSSEGVAVSWTGRKAHSGEYGATYLCPINILNPCSSSARRTFSDALTISSVLTISSFLSTYPCINANSNDATVSCTLIAVEYEESVTQNTCIHVAGVTRITFTFRLLAVRSNITPQVSFTGESYSSNIAKQSRSCTSLPPPLLPPPNPPQGEDAPPANVC